MSDFFHHPTNKQVIVDANQEVIAVVRAPGNRNDIGDANAEKIVDADRRITELEAELQDWIDSSDKVRDLKAERDHLDAACVQQIKVGDDLTAERDTLQADVDRLRTAPMHPAHAYRDHNTKLIAEVKRMRVGLSTLLAHINDMPNPHSDPMRHYFNEMQVWKSDAVDVLLTAEEPADE